MSVNRRPSRTNHAGAVRRAYAAARWAVILALAAISVLLVGHAALAQDGDPLDSDPSCAFLYNGPYHDITSTCVELVWENVTPPQAVPALSGLAFGPDGALYLALTARGEIWALRDTDGDRFMDAPETVAAGLTLPLALAWRGASGAEPGALYVLTEDAVIRLDDRQPDGSFAGQTTIVDGLGKPTGIWPGSLGFGPDGRLYVSLGASCSHCVGVDAIQPGQLVSFAPEGTDRRVEATGLRSPADFAWHPETGRLWIVDGARVIDPAADDGPPDELVVLGAGVQDFGFPSCVGWNEPDPVLAPPGDGVCAAAIGPNYVFPYQSSPAGIAFYLNSPYTDWYEGLLVAFRGSWNLPEPAGYALGYVPFAAGVPAGSLGLISPTFIPDRPLASLAEYSLTGRGFYPDRPVDVVVSADGWLYVALEQGRVLRFRPRIPEDRRQ